MSAIADLLLAVAVAAVWLGCLGFARLTDPFDRLHCVGFVTLAAGLPVLFATWAALGASESVLKVVFLLVCLVGNGAALGHATGRALYYRKQDEPP